ncbi:hypothetical protein CSV71_15000 [Sporosarcina sp. P21c]|uniref:hypothetical protein n=1 Tax=Sporosarcina sp. P21c TaxID=2048255 RepID=UPI000C16590C|nr:hypothetical protein [Sporosarcina sp. P21c]PIC88430.1 hypothetical protein CSV71_15000 [Sporosarcina sp. P21c]
MTKYKVLHDFKDLQDGDKIYKKNDSYPRPANKKVSEKRIKELTSTSNKLGKKVIEEIKGQE